MRAGADKDNEPTNQQTDRTYRENLSSAFKLINIFQNVNIYVKHAQMLKHTDII